MVNDKFNGTAFLEVNPFDGFTAKATAGVELLHNFKGSYLLKSTTYAGEIEGALLLRMISGQLDRCLKVF